MKEKKQLLKVKKERQLKKGLRLLGYSQPMIAEKLKVTTATINNWITGRIFIPPDMVKMFLEMGISREILADPSKKV